MEVLCKCAASNVYKGKEVDVNTHELLQFVRKQTVMQCEADYFVLVICLSAATIHAATSSGDGCKFPEGLMLGSATASYQIEGGWKEDGKSKQQDTSLLSDLVPSNTEILRTKIDFLYHREHNRSPL